MREETDLQEIAQLLTEHAISKFPQKIGIIAVYGSVALKNTSKYSDLDMYAIVDDMNSIDPSIQLVYQNCAIDLWRMDWKKAEKLASGDREPLSPWCVAASLFTNCKILYTRSGEDKKRFEKLKELVKKTTEDKEKNFQRIIDSFNALFAFIERMHFAEVNKDFLFARWASWELINKTCIMLSLLNSRYYTKNWGSNIQQVIELPLVPKDFEQLVKILATSNEFNELIITGRLLITNLRDLVYKEQQKMPAKKRDPSTLSDDFVGIKEYLGKIQTACSRQDILTASYAASELQVWVTELVSEIQGKPAADFNLLNEIDRFYSDLGLPDLSQFISNNDFEGLRHAAKILEERFYQFLANNGVRILNFRKLEDINSYLISRKDDS